MLADGAYCTGENLEEAQTRKLEFLSPLRVEEVADNPARRDDPTQPVVDEDLDRLPRNSRTKCFGKQAFVYDEATDRFHCPAGKTLERSGTEKVKRAETTTERAVYQGQECADCPLAARCRVNPTAKRDRRVTRDQWEPIRERHAAMMRQEAMKKRYNRRQHYGETQFAVLKSVLNLRRFLLRAIKGVRQEWLWGCTAFNVKKLIPLWSELRAGQPILTAAPQN